ncbi:hypothetical protein NPIL_57341 [Nephila pilipes]|uniref:Uncharacterized protein n=1 Tax=Nephila pilipes TaxID=299642 RepID=A0A8X6U1A4_NEPPI|nr:hypothetical protein NPIL_57341 [Nephila pilipes]
MKNSLILTDLDLTEFPTRYVFALLGFLGFFNVYAMRVNLNVAIIAMVKQNYSGETNSQQIMACEELLQEVSYGNSSAKSHSQLGVTYPSHQYSDWPVGT